MKNDIIEELLSDLIAKCEGHMTSPFKKKPAVPSIEKEPEESEGEKSEESESSVSEPEDEEMDEDTMAKLIEAYKKSR